LKTGTGFAGAQVSSDHGTNWTNSPQAVARDREVKSKLRESGAGFL